MDVILLERVESLGQMGDVVKVKPGYARNFLLPQKKALRATKENREFFDKQRAQLEAQNLQRRSDAQAVSSKMENLSVVIIRQAGEFGQLYGSVTTRDIAAAVTAAGFTDLLDGYLARRWRFQSALGGFLDTTADKLLVSGTLIALVQIGRVSTWIAFVIIGRELVLLALKGVAAAGGASVDPSSLGKWKATVRSEEHTSELQSH